MPRRGKIKKREAKPDHFYSSTLISRFINTVMFKGKRYLAEKIVYDSMEKVKQETKGNPLKVFTKAIENIRPLLETKSRRVGGATYQVPVEVSVDRSISLAIRWLLRYAKKRSGKTMIDKLSAEIIDAVNSRGGAFKKKEDTHKMAEANRAFSHYRW